MKLFKEPIDVDFSMRSEPRKEEDVAEFRDLTKQQKAKKCKATEKKPTKAVIPQRSEGNS